MKEFGHRRDVVLETDDEKEAFEYEMKLILELHTHVEHGFGANYTYGGEGASGRKVSQETRDKVKNALLGHDVSSHTRQLMSEKSREWHAKPGVKEMLSERQRKRMTNPETRSLYAGFKGHNHTEASRQKISSAQSGQHKTEATRLKMSESAKRVMSDPSAREKRAKAISGIKRSEETKAKLREAWKKRKEREQLNLAGRSDEEIRASFPSGFTTSTSADHSSGWESVQQVHETVEQAV